MNTVDLIGLGDLTPRDPLQLPTHGAPSLILGSDAEPPCDPPAEDDRPRCAYCCEPDATWRPVDLARGKRGMQPGPGVEYHCRHAFYGAQ